ncbi:MAG: sulfide/dihydroorotate dehydrogenase-like FAD/NAD-binding protein, partial [Oscillospiraceae bacterium]
MFKIVEKSALNDSVILMSVEAPYIANKASAGQFIIFRVDEQGERIPLTIADYNRELGTVTIIFQIVGKSTLLLSQKNAGDYILDFVGPLGRATEFGNPERAIVIGGGVGCAIAYPSAKALHNMGVKVDIIA